MAEVKPIDNPTPVPPADSQLPDIGPTASQLESTPSLLPKQHELVNLELTRSDASDTVSDESQAGKDQPAPLR